MYFLGVIGILAVVVFGAIVSGLNPLSLVDAASLIMVLTPALLAGIAAAKSGELRLSAKALMGSELDDRQKKKAADLLRLMGRVALGAGLVGLLIALIQILQNLPGGDKPLDLAALGRGLSAALLTPLYGLFFKFFVFEPVAARAE